MAPPPTIPVRVRSRRGTRTLMAFLGQNLRELLLREGETPYRGPFRSLNCQGLGLCGSCRVILRENGKGWARRSCQIRCFQGLEIELE